MIQQINTILLWHLVEGSTKWFFHIKPTTLVLKWSSEERGGLWFRAQTPKLKLWLDSFQGDRLKYVSRETEIPQVYSCFNTPTGSTAEKSLNNLNSFI